MRISTHIDVYEPSEDDYRLFLANSMTCVFVSFQPPYLCSSAGRKHGVSIQSLINLSKTFLRISPARNIAQTWIFARLSEYSSSFTSLILDFICWMVLVMVWQWKPANPSFNLHMNSVCCYMPRSSILQLVIAEIICIMREQCKYKIHYANNFESTTSKRNMHIRTAHWENASCNHKRQDSVALFSANFLSYLMLFIRLQSATCLSY